MRGVHGAWQAHDLVMQVALGFIQRWAACQHDGGTLEQGGLALAQLARRILEGAELVHAVVHHAAGLHGVHEGQRHRRVEPGHIGAQVLGTEPGLEQGLHGGKLVVVEACRVHGRMGHQHLQRGRDVAHFDPARAFAPDRLFDEHHAPATGQA